MIRLSYVDFWGRRKGLDLRLKELLSTDKKGPFGLYTIVKTSTAAGSFKLCKFGVVTEPIVFNMIFKDAIL